MGGSGGEDEPGALPEAALDRDFRLVALVVGLVSLITFAWLVSVGRGDLTQSRTFGDVFDLQARAMLQGHLAVPDRSLGFEGFVVDGQTYAYFGIFPSLLRIPLFLVTDRLDGRLTAISMIVAYGVAIWSATAVVARTRALLRPGQPWTRSGLVLGGLLLLVVGLGSNLIFLSSGAWVYHEAALWGAAGVLASFAASLRFYAHPRLRTVVVAGLWAAVAWTSRGSVGLGPSIVLGLLGVAHLTGFRPLPVLVPAPSAALDERGGTGWPRRPRLAAALLVAAAVGPIVFGSFNTAKFGSATSLPWDKQVASQAPWPDRQAALEEYGGSLFSLRLAPAVLVQTFRPDLVRPSATWPFIRFHAARPPSGDGVVFDTVEPSGGLALGSPFLLILGGVGAVAIVRRRRRASGSGRSDAAILRPFLLGGAAGAFAPFTIAFIAQRYYTDAIPLLVVASAGGLAVVDAWADRHRERSWALRRRSVLAGFGVLAIGGVAVFLALTWSYQRFLIPPDPAARAAGIRAQLAVSDVVGSPPSFRSYPELPARAPGPGLAVRGRCLGLYQGQSNGDWVPIEVSAEGGQHRLRVQTDPDGPPASGALVTVGDAADHLVVEVIPGTGGGRSRLRIVRNGSAGAPGPPVGLQGTSTVVVQADPVLTWAKVFVDGREVLFQPGRPPAGGSAAVGADPYGAVAPFTGTVTAEPTPTPTCDALVDQG